MAQGDAFLLVFAIDSVSSWVHLKELRSKIVREKDDDASIPMVVVGNKRVRQDYKQLLNQTMILFIADCGSAFLKQCH